MPPTTSTPAHLLEPCAASECISCSDANADARRWPCLCSVAWHRPRSRRGLIAAASAARRIAAHLEGMARLHVSRTAYPPESVPPAMPAAPLGSPPVVCPRAAGSGDGLLSLTPAQRLAACPRVLVTDTDPRVIESTPQAPADFVVADLDALVARHDFLSPFGDQIVETAPDCCDTDN